MATKKQFAEALAQAAAAGYEYSRTNTKGQDFYSHPRGDELSLMQHYDEGSLRSAIKRMQQTAGTFVPRPKRNTAQIKARAADERARRIEAKRIEVQEARARYEAASATSTDGFVAELIRAIRLRERELAELTALMTSVPADASHRGKGHVRHRTGRPN